MSIYQCDDCGCAENTACGWFHSRNSKTLNKPEDVGKKLCSACATTEWPSGDAKKDFDGTWHNKFKRTFLPHGEFFTNQQGNLQHTESGLIGGEAYSKYGSDTEIAKAN